MDESSHNIVADTFKLPICIHHQHTGLPLIYFPVTPISLCYTSITQNRRNCSSERNIIGKYGSVTWRAICPGVLAWRDTRPRHWPTKFYGKRVHTLTAPHSRVSGAKVSQHRMARLINDGAATSSSLQLASSILSRSAAKLFKEVASPYNGWSPDLQRLISRSTASPCWSVDLQWLTSRSTLVGVPQGGRTWQPFVGSKNGNENLTSAYLQLLRQMRRFCA